MEIRDERIHDLEFVPRIDNWSVCDSFCCTLKFTKKDIPVIWEFIQPYAHSDREFEQRFAAVMLLRFFVKDEWLAAFMMSSILLNPQLIIYSAALGTPALLVRIVSCFLCGITAGILIRIFCKKKSFFDFKGFEEPKNKDTDPNLFIRFLKNLWRNVKATGLYFLVGVLLSALFQRYVPEKAMTFLFGGNEAWGVLMAATIGVPLYVCGGGTIPILQSWLAGGMSMGSATAFMITGPATKITNLGALKAVLGIRNFILYWVFVILFSLLSGLLVNLIFMLFR